MLKQFSTSIPLSEDFPLDKRELFASFLSFSKKINATASQKWLEHSAPVRYEDFLSAVVLSLSYTAEVKIERAHLKNCQKFLDVFLIPLSMDINQHNYRGYKPVLDERFFNSLRRYISSLARRLTENFRGLIPAAGDWIVPIREAFIAKLYADTFLYVIDTKYLEPYSLPRAYLRYVLDEDEYYDKLDFYLDLLEPIAGDTKTSIIRNEINKINNHISFHMMRILMKTTSLYENRDEYATKPAMAELDKSRRIIKEIVGYEALSSSLNIIRDVDEAIKKKTLEVEAGITVLHGLDIPLLSGKEFRDTIVDNSVRDGTKYLIMDKFLPANAYVRVLSVIVKNLSIDLQFDKLRALNGHIQKLTKTIELLPTSSMNLNMQDHFDTHMMIPYVYVSYEDWD